MAAWLWKIQPLKGAIVPSELDVIVIHIRADQAAEYERLFAERELPRWRDYKARGAFLSARISRVAFGTERTWPSTSSRSRCQVMPRTVSMTPIPGSKSSTAWPTSCSQKTRWSTAERCCTPSDLKLRIAIRPGRLCRRQGSLAELAEHIIVTRRDRFPCLNQALLDVGHTLLRKHPQLISNIRSGCVTMRAD